MMSEKLSTAEPAGIKLDEYVLQHPNNTFKSGDDRDDGHAEQI